MTIAPSKHVMNDSVSNSRDNDKVERSQLIINNGSMEIRVAPSNDRKHDMSLIDNDCMEIRTAPSNNKKHDKSSTKHDNNIRVDETLP